MSSKKIKKNQEELPSFLLNLKQIPPELMMPNTEAPIDHYLGPLFFGGCLQHHPPHVVPHEPLPPAVFTTISDQDIFEDMFVEPSTKETGSVTRKRVIRKWHLAKKRESFEPSVAHHRGVRKAFVPDVGPHEIDLGETETEISGEMCREVPVCRVTSCSSISEQYEMINLSDLREKNRPYMSYNERIAHAHFLKEFVTVRIIGPKIPASITLKKLPTKRKRFSDFNFQLQSKKNKQEKPSIENGVKEETVEEGENKENEDDDSIMELMKPISITEGSENTLDDPEMRTPSGMIKTEDGKKESVVKGDDDGPIYDEGEERKSFNSDQQELKGNEQMKTEEEEGGEEGIPENEKPAEENEVKEEA